MEMEENCTTFIHLICFFNSNMVYSLSVHPSFTAFSGGSFLSWKLFLCDIIKSMFPVSILASGLVLPTVLCPMCKVQRSSSLVFFPFLFFNFLAAGCSQRANKSEVQCGKIQIQE